MRWPNLNRMYVHPLFLVGGFILHTALAVLFAVYVAPAIAASVGLSVAAGAMYWLGLSTAILLLAVYRQSTMEGSIIAE